MNKPDEWVGYGDPECVGCKLIEKPALLKLCRAMVGYTEQQIEAGHAENWSKAIVMEGMQNEIVGLLNSIEIDGEAANCKPGADRV